MVGYKYSVLTSIINKITETKHNITFRETMQQQETETTSKDSVR